jgi:hypothetical protein
MPAQHVADRRAVLVGTSWIAFPAARPSRARDQAGVDRAARVRALRAAAQDHRIAGLQAQRARVGRHVRPALVDDADHAERHAHALDDEPVRPRPLGDHAADRIGQRGDLLEPARHGLEPCRVERSRSSIAARGPSRAAAMSSAFAARISSAARARPAAAARAPRCAARPRRARAGAAATPRGRGGPSPRRRPAGSCHLGLLARHHEIVAMDHLIAAAEAEDGLDLALLRPMDAGRVGISSRRRARGRARARGVEHAHRVAALEAAAHRGQARRQQALAARSGAAAPRRSSARPPERSAARDPLLAGRERAPTGLEPGAGGALLDRGAADGATRPPRCTGGSLPSPRCARPRAWSPCRRSRGRRPGPSAIASMSAVISSDFRDQAGARVAARDRPCRARRRRTAARCSPPRPSARHAPRAGRCRRSGSRRSRPCRSR